MIRYNDLFDAVLYESIFLFFFSLLLYLINDINALLLLNISTCALVLVLILWLIGYFFRLFPDKELPDDY